MTDATAQYSEVAPFTPTPDQARRSTPSSALRIAQGTAELFRWALAGGRKMMVRMVLLLVAALVSTNAFAGGLEQLCAAGGYYSGAQAGFMNELANYILQEHEDMKNTKCKTLWQAAYEVGERISKKGQLKPADSAILDNVSAFRKRVYLSIAKGAGY